MPDAAGNLRSEELHEELLSTKDDLGGDATGKLVDVELRYVGQQLESSRRCASKRVEIAAKFPATIT